MLALAKGWLRWHLVNLNQKKKPEDNVIEWKFDVGQMVQVQRSKMIGMVTARDFLYYQGYEVQMSRYLLYFYEYELEPTNKKVVSTVSIEQLSHKRLIDGAYYVRTKRPVTYHTQHFPRGYPLSGISNDCSIGW